MKLTGHGELSPPSTLPSSLNLKLRRVLNQSLHSVPETQRVWIQLHTSQLWHQSQHNTPFPLNLYAKTLIQHFQMVPFLVSLAGDKHRHELSASFWWDQSPQLPLCTTACKPLGGVWGERVWLKHWNTCCSQKIVKLSLGSDFWKLRE